MKYISEKYLDEQSDKEVIIQDFPKECRELTACRTHVEKIYVNGVIYGRSLGPCGISLTSGGTGG